MTFSGGYLTDKIGRKPILTGRTIATVVATSCFLLFPTFEGQALLSFIICIGAEMMVVVLPVIAAESVNESVRGAAMGFIERPSTQALLWNLWRLHP